VMMATPTLMSFTVLWRKPSRTHRGVNTPRLYKYRP
jgi:hypothetical protein